MVRSPLQIGKLEEFRAFVELDYTVLAEFSIRRSLFTKRSFSSKRGELRVLYVEDNEMNQMVLKMMLDGWDNTTLAIANHGKEALRLLNQVSI